MEIIDAVGLRLPCRVCGNMYEVPLRDVLMSHHIMRHEGCPVSAATECPPVAQQFLFAREDVVEFQRAWRRLQQRAQKDGGELVLMEEPATRGNKSGRNCSDGRR